MAGETTIKGILAAIIIAGGTALVGSSTQPWWWCDMVHCPARPPRNSHDGDRDTKPPVATTTSTTGGAPTFHMSELEFGKNRGGSDLTSGIHVAKPDDCASLCLQRSDCQAMTYVNDLTDPSAGGICWMKSAVPGATANANMVSAVKLSG